jgi:ATP-dependent Lon protease
LIPRHNEKDLVELPPEVKSDVTFHLIDTLDDVIPHLFPSHRRKKLSKAPPPRPTVAPPPRVLPARDKPAAPAEKTVRRPRSD